MSMKGPPGLLRLHQAACAVLIALAASTASITLWLPQATAKTFTEPPQCTAIVVPGLPRGHADGRHEAWVYKGHFGRLALDSIFRGGVASDYRFTLGGHALDAVQSLTSKAVLPCLRAKGVSLPSRPTPRVCGGERFKVIIARPSNERFLLLYMASGGNTWRFCRASAIAEDLQRVRPKTAPNDAARGTSASRHNTQKP